MTDSKLLRFLIDLIFPNRCPCCDKIITYDKAVCDECISKIDTGDGTTCVRCSKTKCICCDGMEFDRLLCYFEYKETLRQGILNFKLKKGLGIASFVAEYILKNYIEDIKKLDIDCVTFVPMDRMKENDRGYNQAEVFAKLISKGIDVQYKSLLKKTKKNITQHFLTYYERKKNVSNLYKYVKIVNKKYKHILLCDDIITTGVTLNACAHQLKLMGAEKVYCLIMSSTNKK